MSESCSIERELREGRTVLINTHGVSMRPLLREGRTQVRISPLARPLQVGDLPLVRVKDGLYRLHRVIQLTDHGGCITRGDNCLATEQVRAEDILGYATEIYRGSKQIDLNGKRYGRYVTFWMRMTPMRLFVYRGRLRWQKLKGRIKRFGEQKQNKKN